MDGIPLRGENIVAPMRRKNPGQGRVDQKVTLYI